jgi:hypothetical protein
MPATSMRRSHAVEVLGDVGVEPARQKLRERVRADDSPVLDEGPDQIGRLVARAVEELVEVRVRERDGLLRHLDGVPAAPVAHVPEADEDPELVELPDRADAEQAQAVVVRLQAPVRHEVPDVVRELHDADAQHVERLEALDVVADRGDVLPAQDDPGLALPVGRVDVIDGPDVEDVCRVLPEPAVPFCGLVDRLLEPFPDGDRRVGGRHSAANHVVEDVRRIPVARVATVDRHALRHDATRCVAKAEMSSPVPPSTASRPAGHTTRS